jgi:hypothetical protein
MPMILTIAQDAGSFQSLPPAATILAAVGLGTGLIFWIMGRRLLRPLFAVFGVFAGATVGFFVLPTVVDTLLGVPSPYLGLIVGAALGAAMGFFLFRFAVAITTAVALGLAGALIAATYIHFAPVPASASVIPTPALDTPIPATGLLPSAGESINRAIEAARPMAQQVSDFLAARANDIYEAWKNLPAHEQMVLGVSGLGAAAAGFVLGLVAPKRSAAVATALFGSALWMGCGVWLLEAVNAPGHEHLHPGAAVWLPIWITLAAIGCAVQVVGIRRKKPVNA